MKFEWAQHALTWWVVTGDEVCMYIEDHAAPLISRQCPYGCGNGLALRYSVIQDKTRKLSVCNEQETVEESNIRQCV